MTYSSALSLLISEWETFWKRMTCLRLVLQYPHINLNQDYDIETAVELFHGKVQSRSSFIKGGSYSFLGKEQRLDAAIARKEMGVLAPDSPIADDAVDTSTDVVPETPPGRSDTPRPTFDQTSIVDSPLLQEKKKRKKQDDDVEIIESD